MAVDPYFRSVLTRYRLTPPGWSVSSQPTRIAVLADIHACDPWMSASRITRIVEVTNRLEADLVVLLGDYVHGIWKGLRRIVPARDWGRALSGLEAPLGVYAVLGNHDWEVDGDGTRAALETNGIPVLENDAILLRSGEATPFWIAGLGDQRAIHLGKGRYEGRDDLPGTLAQIPQSDQRVILLAHEPDIFPQVPHRVSLTLSGHTHGGQCRFPLIGAPVVPSYFGQRYVYGHVVEDRKHLIVSAGLGYSGLPLRIGTRPEIVLLELGSPA